MNTITSPEALILKIESSLDSIRPYLKADGGDVIVKEVTPDQIAKLEFVGACGHCSMSSMTFKAGVEAAIKRDVPEIKGVEVVNLTPVAYIVSSFALSGNFEINTLRSL